ncbi:Hypothetical_protein [Hexamita inflata]|uniref:Hypothetical_protein n=1 Tax=Hexamita inflata TaxID=28002 RepID=A0AA86PJT3_9EUKA|nr:Hypothetical protein HINF_LOCUS27252 [Hexamita inflata]
MSELLERSIPCKFIRNFNAFNDRSSQLSIVNFTRPPKSFKGVMSIYLLQLISNSLRFTSKRIQSIAITANYLSYVGNFPQNQSQNHYCIIQNYQIFILSSQFQFDHLQFLNYLFKSDCRALMPFCTVNSQNRCFWPLFPFKQLKSGQALQPSYQKALDQANLFRFLILFGYLKVTSEQSQPSSPI